MAVTRKLPQIPHPSVPLVDTKSGLVSAEWFAYFSELRVVLELMRVTIP